jgi:hypothetical protein
MTVNNKENKPQSSDILKFFKQIGHTLNVLFKLSTLGGTTYAQFHLSLLLANSITNASNFDKSTVFSTLLATEYLVSLIYTFYKLTGENTKIANNITDELLLIPNEYFKSSIEVLLKTFAPILVLVGFMNVWNSINDNVDELKFAVFQILIASMFYLAWTVIRRKNIDRDIELELDFQTEYQKNPGLLRKFKLWFMGKR